MTGLIGRIGLGKRDGGNGGDGMVATVRAVEKVVQPMVVLDFVLKPD